MPVQLNRSVPFLVHPDPLGNGNNGAIVRYWFMTDKDGVFHKIEGPNDLDEIIEQMTDEEFEIWKNRLRFEPIRNQTGILLYGGTMRDMV